MGFGPSCSSQWWNGIELEWLSWRISRVQNGCNLEWNKKFGLIGSSAVYEVIAKLSWRLRRRGISASAGADAQRRELA